MHCIQWESQNDARGNISSTWPVKLHGLEVQLLQIYEINVQYIKHFIEWQAPINNAAHWI